MPDTLEQPDSILEVIEADQRIGLIDRRKKLLRGVVRRDPGGNDTSKTTGEIQQHLVCFGEDRIGVDVSLSTKGETPGIAQ